ncbi:MAG TPA: hypothetical protein VGS57_12090 [Thermoanaerobaculia bacterium]|nr:hypothetical protein [Thermoanaerobaculia bacterium]
MLVLALVASVAHADYRETYRRGIDAFTGKRWEEAARLMRQAIAEHPEAGAGILGMRRYTPHYYLGIALVEQGDCPGAVEAFDTAEKQGKLSREELRDLTQRRLLCRGRMQRVAEAAAAAQREVDTTSTALAQVAAVESSPLMREAWREGSPSLAARQEAAAGQLAAARAQLARAERELDADKVAEAGRSAQAARRELESIRAAATARRDQLQAEAQRELAALRKSTEEARRRVASVSKTLAPLPAAIARQTARVQEAIARAAAADAGTAPADVRHLQDGLKTALRELQAAVKPPPDELQRAAASYFAGNYDDVLTTLAAASFSEPRALAHACLLRAASLHGMYLARGDRGGPSPEQAARQELRRCVASPEAVRPLATVFPPSFLALYAEVAAAGPPG